MRGAALRIFPGTPLTPPTSPLPFFAYPFLAAALVALAVVHWRDPAGPGDAPR